MYQIGVRARPLYVPSYSQPTRVTPAQLDLLDIRKIIGGLFGVYGVLLVLAGIFGSDQDKEQAAGVNINLWVGLALLAGCALFWTWALRYPLSRELEDEGATEGGPQGEARP